MASPPRRLALTDLAMLCPLLVGAGALIVYLATLAPGLTWANNGADGGDLITAAVTRDSVEELGLAPGVPATAAVKATSVMIERAS